MIRRIFWEKTSYDLIKLKNTMIRWVKTCIDNLVKEEMSFGIEVEQDDIQAAVKQFIRQIKTI